MKLSNLVVLAALLLAGEPTFADDEPLSYHKEEPSENDVPYIEITDRPTKAPTTVSPTVSPTASPTEAPTVSPSQTPTVPPSAFPSKLPTVSPTSIPSQAPSKSECETTQGIFGQVSQNADVRIDFSYELEVSVASISNKIIEDDILPDLEGAIVDSILPATFPDDCSMDRRNLRVASRRLEIVAVSKYPEDEILEDIMCTTVSDGNTCVVISGTMTFYANDETDIKNQSENIKKSIQEQMNAGNLNTAHQDITRVSYRTIDPEANGVTTNKVGGDNNGTTNPNPLNPAPIIIGAAALVVVLVGIAYQRRRRNSDSESDATNTQIGSAITGNVHPPEILPNGESQL